MLRELSKIEKEPSLTASSFTASKYPKNYYNSHRSGNLIKGNSMVSLPAQQK